MYRIHSVVSAIILSVIMAAAAAPQDSGRMEKAMGEKMAKELGLSVQQKSQLKDLRKEMREFRQGQMEKMKSLLGKGKEELLKPSPNKDVLYGYAREMGELRRVMAEKEADHLLKVKAILTPDQFAKLLSKDFWRDKGPHAAPGCCRDSLQAKCDHGKGGPHGKCPRGGHDDGDLPHGMGE